MYIVYFIHPVNDSMSVVLRNLTMRKDDPALAVAFTDGTKALVPFSNISYIQLP